MGLFAQVKASGSFASYTQRKIWKSKCKVTSDNEKLGNTGIKLELTHIHSKILKKYKEIAFHDICLFVFVFSL